MAILTLCSASGSPGVTTTAVAMALNWPRPVVLVEADPTGGSAVLTGFLRGTREYETGLVELALSPLNIDDALRDVVRPLAPKVSLIAGVRTQPQSGALRELWPALLKALAELDARDQDVIVDAGRLGLSGSPTPLIEDADLTLLLTRRNLPALAAARPWAEQARDPVLGWRQAALLLIGARQPYRGSEVAKVLGLPIAASLPEDPDAAAVYHRGASLPKRFEEGAFMRSIAAAIQALRQRATRNHIGVEKEAHR